MLRAGDRDAGREPCPDRIIEAPGFEASLLGGLWVVISRVITRVTILIALNRGLVIPLITTPEPPSDLPKTSRVRV